MKKAYMKPDLYVENFSLTQSIASGCNAEDKGMGTPQISTPQTCSWFYKDGFYFTANLVETCYEGEIDIICYNAPNGNVMFAS